MMTSNESQISVTNQVSGVLDYYLRMENDNVLLYYKGPFDQNVLHNINQTLNKKLEESPKLWRKLFAVFIELAQNISYHSDEKLIMDEDLQSGVGVVVAVERENELIFSAGNLIKTENLEVLKSKCNEINMMSRGELRKMKMEVRSRPRSEGQKGGNIGLIQAAIKSESPLKIESQRVNDTESFFLITTSIKI